jgi:hypothetical protein
LLPPKPASILETKSSKKEFAKLKITYEVAVNKRETTRTGRLPILSEILPKTGLNKNCIKEYAATIIPMPKSEMPRSLDAKVGRMGIKMPNPIKSMKTVKNMIVSVAWRLKFFSQFNYSGLQI